ncbi:MAG: endonuclease III [Firmicutes bacterium]|nr:endonuclease III [Bacillota bacterium]
MEQKTIDILDILDQTYPDADCELTHDTPLQLLTSTVLSAQTTDKQVNKVTAVLYRDHPDLDSLLTLSMDEIKDYIRTLGFFNMKAEHLYYMWRMLKDEYGGEVPRTMEELVKLPGVGRKTANVVLGFAFGIPSIPVDTHVFRVSNRLGLAHSKDVEHTEKDLMNAIDPSLWTKAHVLLIFHGRRICSAQRPKCDACPVRNLCEYGGK